MSSHIRLTVAAALLFLGTFARAEDPALPTDPAIVSGTLDNGLSYKVRRHAVPAGRAVFWLHIHSGSLNETDRQRGLAHYIEHMAFNGSENFKPGSLVPFFQSLGMQFGRDQNAFTNMEQTTYQLSLPDVKPETLGKGLLYFADVLFRLSMLPEEIESERQIIQEERRRGLSARQRTGDYVMEHLAPGTIWSRRDTIGTEETINGVKQEDFRDYYGKWYTASNATLMVVADVEPAEVIRMIREKFDAAPKKPRPVPQAPGVKGYEKSFAIVATDAELTGEEVSLTRLEPARPAAATVGQYREDLVLRLGESAMNRRLEAKVARGGTSYLGGRVSAGNAAGLYMIDMTGRAAPGKWKVALQELALELQKARTFGFTARELDDVRKSILSGAERAIESEGTAAAASLISRMNAAVTSGDVMMSPKQRFELLKQQLPTITIEEVTARFAREFNPAAVAFVATLPAGPNVPTEAQLLEIGTAALGVKPEKDAEVAHATELMSKPPAPGSVKEETEHKASQVWSAWLSNNARLHYRFMDYRKNEVTVTITLVGAELLENAENRGITSAAQQAWARPSTKALTSTDIRELFTGRKVDVRNGSGGGGRGSRGGRGGGTDGAGTIRLTISGSAEDLEPGFQLAYLLLTQPRIEESAFLQWQTTSRQSIQEVFKSPSSLGARLAVSLPFPDDDIRTQPVTVEQVDRQTLAAAQAWLEKLIAESPIEISIVGDLPRDRAFDLAARYLGALPSRPRVTPETLLPVRTLKRPAGPRKAEQEIDTPTKQAYVLSGFYGADQANLADARALSMASRILSTRMTSEVREKAQLVYSIGASSRAATTYPGFGVFSAGAPTEPSKTAPLVEKLASMYAEFAKDGPTEEELTVAKKQLANTFEEQIKEPAYWTGKIDLLTWQGTNLDDVVNEPAAYQAMTAKQVKEAFAKYADPKNAIVVVVKPKEEKPGK